MSLLGGIKPGDTVAPKFLWQVDLQLHSSIMATGTVATSLDGMATSTLDSASQVRVQLSTRHPDISLPENPGPILVDTSNVILELFTFYLC